MGADKSKPVKDPSVGGGSTPSSLSVSDRGNKKFGSLRKKKRGTSSADTESPLATSLPDKNHKRMQSDPGGITDPVPPTTPADPNKKLFGIPLLQSAERSDLNSLIPSPISKPMAFLDPTHLKVVGIYRISGSMSKIQTYVQAFDRGEDVVFPLDEDPHVVSGVLKYYLRELPESIFTDPLHHKFKDLQDITDETKLVTNIRRMLTQLPPANLATVQSLVVHVSHIAKFAEENKMTPSNLGIVLSPAFVKLFSTMISHVDTVFEGLEELKQSEVHRLQRLEQKQQAKRQQKEAKKKEKEEVRRKREEEAAKAMADAVAEVVPAAPPPPASGDPSQRLAQLAQYMQQLQQSKSGESQGSTAEPPTEPQLPEEQVVEAKEDGGGEAEEAEEAEEAKEE